MIYCFGDFELDEGVFELRRRGKPIAVQRKVLETILHLVRHRDRLVSRDELFAGPWSGSVVSDAAITQAIKQAREALGDQGESQQVIRTIRGKGVRFVAQLAEPPRRRPPPESEPPRLASPPPSATFVGRQRELAQLQQALDAAHAGTGQVILLCGDAGIGKTTILKRLAREAKEHHIHVWWGRGWEVGGTPPFWPWLEPLRSIVESADFPRLGRPPETATRWLELAPEMRERVPLPVRTEEPFADARHARVRLFDSVTRFLTWAADRMDMLLLLEDLHAADPDSIALLRFAAPRLRASRLLIVATFRPDEPQARALLLHDRPDAELVFLRGLAARDVEELLGEAAPLPVESDLTTQIHRLTGGNPLMVTELLATHFSGPQDTVPSDEPSFSLRWRECFDRRIARLPESTAKFLEVAAIAGSCFELPFVANVGDIDEREALARLWPAIERGIVRGDSRFPGVYEFAHTLFRDAAGRRLTPQQRGDVHARCAGLLERHEPLEDQRVYRVAHHYWMSSTVQRSDRARVWAIEAAGRARRAHAYEAESEQLAHALELGEGVASASSEGLDLALRLAEAQRLAGNRSAAIATLERVASMSRAAGDTKRFADSTIGRFDVMADAAFLDAVLQEQIAEALALESDETPQRAVLLALKAFSRHFYRSFAEGRELSDEALRIARRSLSPPAVARVLMIGIRFCEDGRRLLPLATELVAAGEQANQLEMLLEGHLARSGALLQLGRIHEWQAETTEYERLARRIRHPTHTYRSTLMSAVPLVLAGDFDGAYERACLGYQMGAKLGEPAAAPAFGSTLLSIHRAGEERAAAPRWLHQLRDIAAKIVDIAPALLEWRVEMMNIEHALGRVDSAKREFRRIVDPGCEAIHRDSSYVLTLTELGRMAALLGEQEHAEKLYALLLPYAGLHVAPWGVFMGPVHYSLALLGRALGDAATALQHLELALADAERVEARSWIGKIRGEMLAG
jgi:DNA-binding winged helix-turn-helix (wHTH) protein/tetratricopeptide (TPR) repeat protein